MILIIKIRVFRKDTKKILQCSEKKFLYAVKQSFMYFQNEKKIYLFQSLILCISRFRMLLL